MMILIVAIATFALCFAVDKGFSALFRSKSQQKTGLAVRLPKRYGIAALLLILLGIVAVMAGVSDSKLLLFGGIALTLVGIALAAYYLSFGVFYDEDTFLVTNLGKRGTAYRFSQIQGQMLYQTGGGMLVELYLDNGKTVGLQSAMEGAYPFLDHAFAAWCRQKGLAPEQCDFHDPANSLWFPTVQ